MLVAARDRQLGVERTHWRPEKENPGALERFGHLLPFGDRRTRHCEPVEARAIALWEIQNGC
jgi:hypothetical protein